jgi:serine protease Do
MLETRAPSTLPPRAPAQLLRRWTSHVKLGELPAGEQVAMGGDPKQAEPRWGLQLSDIPAELKAEATEGALVTAVQPASKADDAGVRPGDIIVDVAGQHVKSAADAQRLLREAKSPVRVLREGRGLFLVLNAQEKS